MAGGAIIFDPILGKLRKNDAASGAIDAVDVNYDNSGSGLSATDVQAAIDELDAAASKQDWSHGGASRTNTTNRYLDGFDGVPLNQSPYIAKSNLRLKSISAGTFGAETWIAEVRVDNGGGFSVVASLSITAADSDYVDGLNVLISQGSKIAFYCNGTAIRRPNITAIFEEQ